MRKIKYSSNKIKQLVKHLKKLGTIEKDVYSIKFIPEDTVCLSKAKKFLDSHITEGDALGFQTDYSGKFQTITIFTDSI